MLGGRCLMLDSKETMTCAQVFAPGQEVMHGAGFGAAGSHRLESSLHLQGAVAVSGEATLWKNNPDPHQWPQTRRNESHPFDEDLQASLLSCHDPSC